MDPGDCIRSESDVEELSCQWSNITHMLKRGDTKDTEVTLKALLEVCFGEIIRA